MDLGENRTRGSSSLSPLPLTSIASIRQIHDFDFGCQIIGRDTAQCQPCEDWPTMVDVVQKCAHLIEALNNAQPDAKVFRNHCLEISSCANQLLPQILNIQKQVPNLGDDPGASEVFNKLNATMEEALTLLRKCATMSKLDKMMDQGLSFVHEQKAQLPTGLVSHIPTVPKNLVPEGLMHGLSKTIFGDHGPPSGDTKSHLVAVLEQLQKSTREVEACIKNALNNKFPGGSSSKSDEDRKDLLS